MNASTRMPAWRTRPAELLKSARPIRMARGVGNVCTFPDNLGVERWLKAEKRTVAV